MFALVLLIALGVTYFVVQTQPLKAYITAGITFLALITLFSAFGLLSLAALGVGGWLTWNQRESLGLKK
jgi:uncharacterized membrane protein YqjE